ncbi:hypothetical protein PtA15_2A13 [Puccinia triticina]|uniref:Uncharacterized protein n=1 Tax=Puccinia triticina TaxID=208348 RepID=A0ABY7CFW8_9BASI|nr:uncharacterized protein PtA15_2A13 [Puccinia triticina]WAQ81702.1 hypothetical protein PtA15_2A13 [Puccinia triticina]WAR52589.1 hypothetical protein PtB15_2B13 [Puccinia triticina]
MLKQFIPFNVLVVLFFGCSLVIVSLSQPLISSNTSKDFILKGRSHWPVGQATTIYKRQPLPQEDKTLVSKTKTPSTNFKRPTLEIRELSRLV